MIRRASRERKGINPMLIDAHAHLDKYEADLASVLEAIRRQQILTISTSMDFASYERNQEIADRCEWVLPTFGIHPWNASQHADQLDRLHEPIRRSSMLGEIGLDYYWVKEPSHFPAQRAVLDFFLAAAKAQNKIVNLHTKGAEKDILDGLNHHGIDRAIIHWYSGPKSIFRKLIARGAYFTFGVEVLSSKYVRTLARAVPSELLLTETDNPGGMKWLTGEVGMPHMINDVVKTLAELRGSTPIVIAQTVCDNFHRLIWTDPWMRGVRERFFGAAREPECGGDGV